MRPGRWVEAGAAAWLCLFLGAPPVSAAARSEFDISYLWHADLASVRDYRERLATILGPGIRQRLLIVRGEESYGLVYDRNGDASSTHEVARGHSRLLRSRGLDAAAPILSRRWDVVDAGAVRTASRTEAPPRSAPPRVRAGLPAAPAGLPAAPAGLPAALSLEVGGSLEAKIERFISDERRRGRVSSDERTSWGVYDLTHDRKLVSINADAALQAASLIKPAVAVAFFHRVAAGELTYGRRSRANMEAMIRESSNPATNWVMRHVGGPQRTEALLREHYADVFRDIHLVEYIPGGGRTYRNRDSVNDYLRLLYAVWHDQVPYAAELRRLMALENRDRLTGELPASVRVYDKTGSTRSVCGNLGILEVREDGRRLVYAIAGVIEKQGKARHYGSWIRSRGDVIRRVSGLVYRELTTEPQLTASGARGAR